MINTSMKNKDIKPYNEKGERHGLWVIYWLNGAICYKGNYINGKLKGLWECYNEIGEIYEQIFYA